MKSVKKKLRKPTSSGATFKIEDSHYLKLHSTKTLNELEKTLVETTWDQETDYDESAIKKEMLIVKNFKRIALVKLLTLVPETLAALVICTKKQNTIRWAMNKLYIKLLFNKITYNQFKKDLITISKDDTILV